MRYSLLCFFLCFFYIKSLLPFFSPSEFLFLKKTTKDVFWHLKHSLVGIDNLQIKKDQPLAWNFSLWNLAPQKGQDSRVAIIDQFFIDEKFCMDFSLEKNSKFDMAEKLFALSDLYSTGAVLSPDMKYATTFLSQFLKKNYVQNHGLYTIFILKQIAPCAKIFFLNSFDSKGLGYKKDFFSLISKKNKNEYDILHCGFKFLDNLNFSINNDPLQKTLSTIPYIVAAAGNDQNVKNNTISYPARYRDVAFDIGSFYQNEVCLFSQFEPKVGPKIVAPGENIVFPFSVYNKIIGYGIESGTSAAAAIFSGFLSLAYTEFKRDFSYKEFLTVIYSATKKIDLSTDSEQKALLGAVDMRTALFLFHVLKEIKALFPIKKQSTFYFYIKIILFINDLYLFDEYKELQDLLFYQILHFHPIEFLAKEIAKLAIIAVNSPFNINTFEHTFEKRTIKMLKNIKRNIYLRKYQLDDASPRIMFSLNRKIWGKN
ncbi:S8/S53 family peptidase [Candidatus Dependentiae bacterium]|nr:S8/S53 family peptidase [Candidatus Dependentiae bacterium]